MVVDASAADAVEKALDDLREAVAGRVRAEQLRDALTNLGNEAALTGWLAEAVEKGIPFWIAFIEVDRFKTVNQRFGYQDANELLKAIAQRLEGVRLQISGVVPFRAHGDEFYLVAPMQDVTDSHVAGVLEDLRNGISLCRIPVRNKGDMQCTVSIGWVTSARAQQGTQELTATSVLSYAEIAVAVAKHERNRVVEFTPDMEQTSFSEARPDCSKCHTSFSMMVPQEERRTGPLHCPNCGQDIDRPESLLP